MGINNFGEVLQILCVRQFAKQQEPGNFFKEKAVLIQCFFDDAFNVNAAVDQFAVDWLDRSVFFAVIADNITDIC